MELENNDPKLNKWQNFVSQLHRYRIVQSGKVLAKIIGICFLVYVVYRAIGELYVYNYGEDTKGIVLEIQKRRKAGLGIHFGYFIGDEGFVDYQIISLTTCHEGECVDIKYSTFDSELTSFKGDSYVCDTALTSVLVYGKNLGVSVDTIHLEVKSDKNHYKKIFASSKYFLPLDFVSKCEIKFSGSNVRDKILILERDTIEEDWTLNIDPTFKNGDGTDTLKMYFDKKTHEWITDVKAEN